MTHCAFSGKAIVLVDGFFVKRLGKKFKRAISQRNESSATNSLSLRVRLACGWKNILIGKLLACKILGAARVFFQKNRALLLTKLCVF